MPMHIRYVLQRCSGGVMRWSYVRRLFDKAVDTSEESALLDIVFTEWTRKIMHAHVNDWFSALRDAILTAKGKHSRGGHTLRDTLYALSKRSKNLSKFLLQCAISKVKKSVKKNVQTSRNLYRFFQVIAWFKQTTSKQI